MKFDTPAGANPVDNLIVIGRPHPRIEGPLKTTGAAEYSYERQETINPAYGCLVCAGIPKGRIRSLDVTAAKAAPGVLAIVTAKDAGELGKGKHNTAKLLGGPDIEHYHQAIAIVVAESFEQARSAASLVQIEYDCEPAAFDLAEALSSAPYAKNDDGKSSLKHIGDFNAAFEAAAVKIDATYTTPDQSHMMMEPFASIAMWEGDQLTVWTSNQMINWGRTDLAATLKLPKEKVRLISPYVGGGFGGKLFLRADAVLAALGAKATKRPVKVAIPRPLIANNSTHRPATVQRVRIGADADGTITSLAHESGSGDLPGGAPETAVNQSRLLYAGANRLTSMRLATLNLPEGNSMRAPGEAPGMMALEIAMDELAEKLGIDPVELRIKNDTQVDPEKPERPFSDRNLTRCLQEGASQFGWHARNPRPGHVRDGRWLIGLGMAAAFRNSMLLPSGARVTLSSDGLITVETDMTDIGTGSYTIIAQTAAEMLGLSMDNVRVNLADSNFPVSSGSGGQFGAASSTSGVYAACSKLREMIAQKLGFNAQDVTFANGLVSSGNRSTSLVDATRDGPLSAEDKIEPGDLEEKFQISTFGAHFVEVGVDIYTGMSSVRRMLAVCDAGRILNPTTARSQVIGAMTMGVGAALMEGLVVDKRRGFFVNHDLAGYEVPVHLDIPHQDVVFIDSVDPKANPLKAKGIAELGICGVGAAIANAVYNATGVRVRNYPITLDKYLHKLPTVA